MNLHSSEFVKMVAHYIELFGMAIIVMGAVYSTILFSFDVFNRTRDAYASFRKNFGRSILLGLEFLVAGDIISTIVIEPSVGSVAVLGLIILIRTFLSLSLEVEIDRRWPWKS